MPSVTAFEAKTRFGQLLDRVAAGEEITITRREKAVARLVPVSGADVAAIRKSVDAIRGHRRAMSKRKDFKPLSDHEVSEAIHEGRP